jgi:hypothetical protein
MPDIIGYDSCREKRRFHSIYLGAIRIVASAAAAREVVSLAGHREGFQRA